MLDLTAGAVVVAEPVLLEEFDLLEEILATDDGWCEALTTRGLAPGQVRVAPLSAGVFDYPGEGGRRLLRGLAFVQTEADQYAWGNPVDQLVAFVDMIDRRVVRIIEDGPAEDPLTSGNFEDPALTGPVRNDLKPLHITQPEGPSFHLDGNALHWWKWDVHLGFDAREGLVLHRIRLRGPGRATARHRPGLHRGDGGALR
ncbi:MAG: hypothetical protein ACK5LS_06680 [Propioniciclava sp.]